MDSSMKRKVFVELVKPSDDSTSEPQEFFYCPSEAGVQPVVSQPTRKESEKAAFKNLYNGGNCVTEVKKEKLRIKQESVETGWSSTKVQARHQQPQYQTSAYQNNLNIQQQMLNNQTISYNIKNMGYNIPTTSYVPNIPNNYLTQLNSPYTTSQQSPDSQGFSELQHSHHQLCSKHSKQLPDPAEQPLHHLPAVPRLPGVLRAQHNQQL